MTDSDQDGVYTQIGDAEQKKFFINSIYLRFFGPSSDWDVA